MRWTAKSLEETPSMDCWDLSRSWENWTMALWARQYFVKNANLFFHPVALGMGGGLG